MNPHDKFIADRNRIVDALGFSDIPTIQFNKDAIPKQLPCAIVILDSDTCFQIGIQSLPLARHILGHS
jgi:hypothetical protein